MIFLAAIDWLSITINLLLVVFVIVCLLMTLVVLMQRPKQEGLGAAFGGGVTDQVFGARTTNVLQRGTVYLGSLFFLISLALALLIGKQSKQPTLAGTSTAVAEEVQAVEQEAEVGPEVEVVEGSVRSLVDELDQDVTPGDVPAEDAPVEETPEEETPVEGAAEEDEASEEDKPE